MIPGFEVMIWIGYVAPAGMTKETMAKLNEHCTLRSPEVSKPMEDRSATVIASTPEQFSRTVQSDLERWGKVVRDSNITIQ